MSLPILTLILLAIVLQMGRIAQAAQKQHSLTASVFVRVQHIVSRPFCLFIARMAQLWPVFYRTLGMLVSTREFAQRYAMQPPQRSLTKSAARHNPLQSSNLHRIVSR